MGSPIVLDEVAAKRAVEALVGSRGGVNDVYHRIEPSDLQTLFSVFVSRLRGYLSTGDERAYGDFLRRWVVVRAAAGALLENLIPAIVAIGDAVGETLAGEGDTEATRRANVALARASLLGARIVNEVLAAEYAECRSRAFDIANPDEDTRR